MSSDEQLILDFQRGSRESLEELFARYRQPLYAFFRRRLSRRDAAEDLTQQTFVTLMRNSTHYEPRSLFRTYLYGIAVNLLSAERRKQARSSVEINRGPAEQVETSDVLWVREALCKLDSHDREVVMLREYEQLSYSEIAQLLNIPLNTVRSRLFRGRVALKGYLKPQSAAPTGTDL